MCVAETDMHRPGLIFILAVPSLATGILDSVAAPSTNAPTVLPETIVIGHAASSSLTSPSADKAAAQKMEIPGGFSLPSCKTPRGKGKTPGISLFPGFVTHDQSITIPQNGTLLSIVRIL